MFGSGHPGSVIAKVEEASMALSPIRCLLVASMTAALAAACSPASSSRGNATAIGWTRADLTPVTQPAPVAGRFVLYVSSARQLSVVGLNARTGATVWSDAATQSSIPPGVAPDLAVVGGVVVYVHSLGAQTADLVGADAATGRVIWHTSVGDFTSWPQLCPFSLFPCNDQQHSVPTPPHAPSFVGAIGASADGLVAWSEPSAVVAVRQSR